MGALLQDRPKIYLPSLEGIRALAFLLVFLVHYSGPSYKLINRPAWQYPWFLGCYLSMCAVPVFFALSGYLITGVLFDSRHKSGYFRVFYLRRFVRVFPLYYLALFIAFTFRLHSGNHLSPHHLLLFFYLHNWWVPNNMYAVHPLIDVGHFWSLAVEEQFYLVWPVVVWILPDRKQLLCFCYVTIGMCFLARCCWPFLHLPSYFAYQNTVFRFDAIMMGSVLFLHQRGSLMTLHPLVKPSLLTLALGSTVIIIRGLMTSTAPGDLFGVIVVQPILSLMGTSILVLALAPGTLVNKASQWRWTVHLGKRSYGLYVFHQFFMVYEMFVFLPAMIPYLGRGLGRCVGTLLVFGLTYLTASLTYRFIEVPALNLKRSIKYGSASSRERVPVVSLQEAA